MKRIALVVLALALTGGIVAAQDLERLFTAARNKETVDRDCRAAIEQYKKVAAGSNRMLAAQALLRMAGCYQKLGDSEAQRVYARIVSDYGDQSEVVAEAHARMRQNSDTPGASRGDRIVLAGATSSGEGRVSPDGRLLSYVSWNGPKGLNLMVHDVVNHTERALTDADWNTGAAGESAFSPDAKQLAYGWRKYGAPNVDEVRIVALDATSMPRPRTLYKSAEAASLSPTDWSSDGTTLAVVVKRVDGTNQISLIGLDGSYKTLKTIEGWRAVGKVFFSPDGRYLAYDAAISDTDTRRDIFIIARDGSDEKALQNAANDMVMGWSRDGTRLIFASDRNATMGLWAAAVTHGRPSTPVLMKPDVGSVRTQGITNAGALFVIKDASTVSLQIASLDFEGNGIVGPSSLQVYRPQTPQRPAWSADGKWLAYAVRAADGSSFLAVRETSGQVRELHPPVVYIPQLQWFADGRSLLVQGRDIKGRWMTLRVDVETGESSRLISGVTTRMQTSPDGKNAYYVIADGTLVETELATGVTRKLFQKPEGTGASALSPDGRYIAIVRAPSLAGDTRGSSRSNRSTLLLYSIPGGDLREIDVPSNLQAFYGLDWAPQSDAILAAGEGPEPALWLIKLNGEAPRRLNVDVRNWVTPYGIRVAPNGKQIAYFTGTDASEVWAFDVMVPKSQ